MSNSAFTPSTSTVTNNVPVNVPVVTGYQSYIPTTGGLGTPTPSITSVRYRQLGDSIEIQGYIKTGTVAASTAFISLPSGLTIDSSKITNAANAQKIGDARKIETATNATALAFLLFYDGSDTSNMYIAVTSASNTFTKNNGSFFFSSGDGFTFTATVPISQWSSGTTTLADRAVEEYVSHDGTSIVRGPAGSLVPNVAASINTTAYTVDFSQALQPTDAVVLEYSRNNLGWHNAADFAPFSGGNNSSASNFYGIRVYKINATQFYIEFGNQGSRVQASNVSAGATSWAEERTAGTRFRLRKVSSGAQVGFPVSARNIVGDTSGTVVPTGMLGEIVNGSTIANPVVIATSSTAVSSITLQPGRWALKYSINPTIETGATAGNRTYAYFRIRDSADTTTIANSVKLIVAKTTGNLSGEATGVVSAEVVVDVSTPTTYLLRGIRVDGSGTGIASVYNGGTTESSNFYAIRIA